MAFTGASFVPFIELLLAWFKAVGSGSGPQEIIMVMSPGLFLSLALVRDDLRLYCVQIPVVFLLDHHELHVAGREGIY